MPGNLKERQLLMAKEVMTVEEVAEYLRVTSYSIYEWAKAGKMPAAKVGRLWRFHRDEIDEWLRSGGLEERPRNSDPTRHK